MSELPIDRGAWRDVPNATEWLEELRGNDPEPSYFGLTKDHTWLSCDKTMYDKLKPEFRMACYPVPQPSQQLGSCCRKNDDQLAAVTKHRDELLAENASIRELMNCYNLGGWTDSLMLIKQRDIAVEALKKIADDYQWDIRAILRQIEGEDRE